MTNADTGELAVAPWNLPEKIGIRVERRSLSIHLLLRAGFGRLDPKLTDIGNKKPERRGLPYLQGWLASNYE